MAKQGQHNNDQRDQDISRGHNNPDKSVTVTTGTPKKHETYEQQAHQHRDTGKPAQAAKNDWTEDGRQFLTHEADSHARQQDHQGHNGSESNRGSDKR